MVLSNVKVSQIRTYSSMYIDCVTSDSCNVNNGGCDKYATCSHDSTTFAVVCTCKTGYTNVGTGSTVKCEGTYHAAIDR